MGVVVVAASKWQSEVGVCSDRLVRICRPVVVAVGDSAHRSRFPFLGPVVGSVTSDNESCGWVCAPNRLLVVLFGVLVGGGSVGWCV